MTSLRKTVSSLNLLATFESAARNASFTVAAAERNDRMTLLVWVAPKEYYHGRDAAAVDAMLDGMRFK